MIKCIDWAAPEDTMVFEEFYHPNLRYTLEEKKTLYSHFHRRFAYLVEDGKLVGESYGLPEGGNLWIYCESTTVLTPGKGYGSILKAYWLGVVLPYRGVHGHARPGASQALITKFGGRFVKDEPDWYGTGETYKEYVMDLTTEEK